MYRALPYDCGASLPLVQRYTDWRFRRICRGRVERTVNMDPDALLELVALLQMIEPSEARWIFHWRTHGMNAAARHARNPGLVQAAEPLRRANAEALQPEHCLALIQAMRDGGWKKPGTGPLPGWFKLALRAWRDRGLSVEKIAKLTGFSYWTIQYAFRVPHGQRMAVSKRGLAV